MREEVGQGVGWAVVAALFAATTCVESMSWNQLTAYTPLYLRELHVPAAQVPGWIAAISSLGWVLALPLAPFWGVLADRYSRKLIIVRSAAIEAVIFAGWALSEIISRPVVLRLFLATAAAQVGLWTMLPYVPLYIARLSPGDTVTAVGVVLSIVGLGQAVASALWGIVIPRLGYVAVLSATSVGSCVALTVAGWSHCLPLFAIALLVNAVCLAAILTTAMSVMAATVSPERRGAVLGQILFPFYVGGVIGPLIGGVAFAAGQLAVFGSAAVLSLSPLLVPFTMLPAAVRGRTAWRLSSVAS